MRCVRCGKNFDEELHSGICPKCGHFNNRQKEYDVSKYISARFDGADDKVSTSEQAARQHEQLHRMYDAQNMHKAGAGSHEKLHEMYDKYNMHGQSPRPLTGDRQPVPMGKINPYQGASPVQTGNKYQPVQTGNYGQSRYGQANAHGTEKNIVTPICIVTGILAIACTVALCNLKRQSLEKNYYTLDFEQETAQPGELFEIKEQLLIVDQAESVDTSALDGMPEGEKLVAVSVQILPSDGRGNLSGNVYVSDGSSCKMPLNDYTVCGILYDGDYSMGEDILSQDDFQDRVSEDGKTGKLYFFVDEDAGELSISFEEGNRKEGIYVLDRRVSVPLRLEEE